MDIGQKIKTYKELKGLTKKNLPFEVKVKIKGGLFTRKRVDTDLNCFNYIDDTRTKMRTETNKKKYWERYIKKFSVHFNGWDEEE